MTFRKPDESNADIRTPTGFMVVLVGNTRWKVFRLVGGEMRDEVFKGSLLACGKYLEQCYIHAKQDEKKEKQK